MDEKITDILMVLDQEEDPSQREIANQVGFSVGSVNALIKKCAKKDFVKIERINARNIKYILTPKGMKEKTKKTINYIQKSYQAIKQLENKVTELAVKHDDESKTINIYNKESGEIFDLVTSTLDNLDANYSVVDTKEQVKSIVNKKDNVIYYWNSDLDLNNESLYNILKVKS